MVFLFWNLQNKCCKKRGGVTCEKIRISQRRLFQEAKDPEPTPPTPTIVTPGNPAGSTAGGKSIVQKIQERLGE